MARTRESLRYRLDELIALPNVRAMLCSAKGSIDPSVLLSSRLTIVNLASTKIGLGKPSIFVGSWIFALLASAIFRRDPGGREHPSWVFVDEWQLLARHLADSFGDILSLARSRNVGLCLANQYPAQIRAASPALWEGVNANVAWRALFHPDRAALQDVSAYIPATGRIIDPARPDRLLDPSAERAAVERVLTTLPARRAVLVNERDTAPLELLTTLTLPVARARDAWQRLPASTRARWQRGRHGVPIADLAPVRLALGEHARPAPNDEAAPGSHRASREVVPRENRTRFPKRPTAKLMLGGAAFGGEGP